MVSRMESETPGSETKTAMVNNNNFIEAAGPDIVNTNIFTVAGYGLTCFRGASVASFAFSVRICLHRPLMSSIGGTISWGIMGSG